MKAKIPWHDLPIIGMLLDDRISPKIKKIKKWYNKHLIWNRWMEYSVLLFSKIFEWKSPIFVKKKKKKAAGYTTCTGITRGYWANHHFCIIFSHRQSMWKCQVDIVTCTCRVKYLTLIFSESASSSSSNGITTGCVSTTVTSFSSTGIYIITYK
jgi:hypothetical protein